MEGPPPGGLSYLSPDRFSKCFQNYLKGAGSVSEGGRKNLDISAVFGIQKLVVATFEVV